MTEKNHNPKEKSKLNKFLFYAKFTLLIIVAGLFAFLHSFSYREFPSSTARGEFVQHGQHSIPANPQYPMINILVIVDCTYNYEDDAYSHFYLIRDLIGNIKNANYDLVLLENNKNYPTILDNISQNLLLRIYKGKEYHYIIPLGDKAITPAKEIKDLFAPSAKILLCGIGSKTIYDTLAPVLSASTYVPATMSIAEDIHPDSEKVIFICDDGNYSQIVINIAKECIHADETTSFEALYPCDYSMDEVCQYINEQSEKVSIFYVSFAEQDENNEIVHSSLINEIQQRTNRLIFDLSPINLGNDTRNSVRYWFLEASGEPQAYLALTPETAYACNYELVEFAAMKILPPDEALQLPEECVDISSFISLCMKSEGLDEFPDTLDEQLDFCRDNSIMIQADDLQIGDLIFTTTEDNASIDAVTGIAMYVNKDIVININKNGAICFTKPIDEKFCAAYARPYSLIKH